MWDASQPGSAHCCPAGAPGDTRGQGRTVGAGVVSLILAGLTDVELGREGAGMAAGQAGQCAPLPCTCHSLPSAGEKKALPGRAAAAWYGASPWEARGFHESPIPDSAERATQQECQAACPPPLGCQSTSLESSCCMVPRRKIEMTPKEPASPTLPRPCMCWYSPPMDSTWCCQKTFQEFKKRASHPHPPSWAGRARPWRAAAA